MSLIMQRRCTLHLHSMKLYYMKRLHSSLLLLLKSYHHYEEPNQESSSFEWYQKAYTHSKKLSQMLKNVDQIDGRILNIHDNSIIIDDYIERRMHTFKLLAKSLILYPCPGQALEKTRTTLEEKCFGKVNQRENMTLSSITKICDFLDVSAQKRKLVRLAICPQVTQQNIVLGTMEHLLKELKLELDILSHHFPTFDIQMGKQIISCCLQFLDNTLNASNHSSSSWTRLSSSENPDLESSHTWSEVLEMFDDIVQCLKKEEKLTSLVSKVEVMKEGLYLIKNVKVDKDIGYREVRRQEGFIQKNLSKNLGLPSRCLFTLLLYYLHRNVRDIEVELRGGLCEIGGGGFCLCFGKILSSDEEVMVRSGVKQLDRILGLFKFVWEIAEMKGTLKLQGHLWCVGAFERKISYKGNEFFVHNITL